MSLLLSLKVVEIIFLRLDLEASLSSSRLRLCAEEGDVTVAVYEESPLCTWALAAAAACAAAAWAFSFSRRSLMRSRFSSSCNERRHEMTQHTQCSFSCLFGKSDVVLLQCVWVKLTCGREMKAFVSIAKFPLLRLS